MSTRKYWIVKHGFDALQALPHCIWRTGETDEPAVFRRVKKGDQWIGFAYTASDARERALSLVTGFSECTRESAYEPIPERVRKKICGRHKKAWFIKGEPSGWQPQWPVGVPAIEDLIERNYFRQTTLVEVTKEEFDDVRSKVREREFDPKHIPAMGREPRNEQEVLAVIVAAQAQLGIEQIIRVRTGFPDMMVKLKGKAGPVHLELELYSKSYLAHGHGSQVSQRDYFSEEIAGRIEKRPFGILCWIDDADRKLLKAKGKVSRVFELQQLIRDRESLRWK